MRKKTVSSKKDTSDSTATRQEAIIDLLVEKGVFTKEELVAKVNDLQRIRI